MKGVFAKHLKNLNGKEINSYFLCDDVSVRKTKNGKQYTSLQLSDVTGRFFANAWSIERADCRVGDVVQVVGMVGEWQGKPQISITKVRVAKENEYSLEDFKKSLSSSDLSEFEEELRKNVASMSGSYATLVALALEQHRDAFVGSPAAEKIHHAYPGGLLEHTVCLMRLAKVVSELYNLNLSLMYAGCFFHDLGKIDEIGSAGYTKEGVMQGHIVIGLRMLERARMTGAVDEEAFNEVAHLIASHHGQKDWGSPVIPATREAIAMHLIDMIDSRMKIADEAINEHVDDDGFTDKVFALGTKLYAR